MRNHRAFIMTTIWLYCFHIHCQCTFTSSFSINPHHHIRKVILLSTRGLWGDQISEFVTFTQSVIQSMIKPLECAAHLPSPWGVTGYYARCWLKLAESGGISQGGALLACGQDDSLMDGRIPLFAGCLAPMALPTKLMSSILETIKGIPTRVQMWGWGVLLDIQSNRS